MGALSGPAAMAVNPALGIQTGLATGQSSLNKLNGKGPLSGMIGQAGGAAGTGFSAPQNALIQQGTGVGDVQGAQTGTANSLASQQALLSALQGQNGLGQQNAVAAQQQTLANQLAANNGAANQAAAMGQQQGLNANLAAANGVGTQNQAIHGLQGIAGQQAGTAAQYQNIANGTGPNPAQAALNQATGQNVANQAALMAGQRGAGANVGLMARQAALQGAATQQQAAGQGATLQAQQQIAGLQGLAGQQQAMAGTQQAIGGLGTTQAGMQQAGIGQQGSLAGQQLAAQQAQQAAMANQANAVAGQQIGATTANSQANLANQQQMQGALQGINNSNVASQGNINSGNAGLAQTQMQGQQGLLGGLMSGAGAAAGLAKGGEVQKMADGGVPAVGADAAAPAAAPSSFGQFLKGWSTGGGAATGSPAASSFGGNSGAQALDTGATNLGKGIAKGRKKAGAGSGPGGEMMAGADSAGMGNPAEFVAAMGGLAKSGGHVKAKDSSQKATKGGDSYANDKVPAKLSEGEIVLPRSVTMSKDPVAASAAFVQKVLAKRRSK